MYLFSDLSLVVNVPLILWYLNITDFTDKNNQIHNDKIELVIKNCVLSLDRSESTQWLLVDLLISVKIGEESQEKLGNSGN